MSSMQIMSNLVPIYARPHVITKSKTSATWRR